MFIFRSILVSLQRQKWQIMLGKLSENRQRELFRPMLKDFINPGHGLVMLADAIDWTYFEETFKSCYSKNGAPGVPLRLMVGCLLLKHLYDPGDGRVPGYRESNPYVQYFCGGVFFEHGFPFDPSDFVHFRKRVGEEGIAKIFAYGVKIHGHGVSRQARFVLPDTTVQENNTTFPTDAKLCKKVIDRCNKTAGQEGIRQRQRFTRESRQLLREGYSGKHPKRTRQARKAKKRLKTIASKQLRELECKMDAAQKKTHGEQLELYRRAVNRQRTDKDKVYSLHKPFPGAFPRGNPTSNMNSGTGSGW
jgi:IS5 family transposase